MRSPLTALLLVAGAAAAQPLASTDLPALRREVAAVHVAQARAEERAGRTLDAEDSYRQALLADPACLDGALGEARLLRDRGRPGEALARLTHLGPDATPDDDARVRLADALAGLGRPGDALALLRVHADTPAGWHALARLAAHEGAFPEALAAARRAVDGGDHGRDARLAVRALGQLAAESDCVRHPPAGPRTALRDILARDDGSDPR